MFKITEKELNKPKTVFEEIKLRKVQLKDLKPQKDNPNNHPDSQLSKLQKSFAQFGYGSPILVDSENNIITGHGRYKAISKLAHVTNETMIQVVELPLSKEQAKAYMLADNRIGEDSEWDKEKLFEVFKDLEVQGMDVLDTGFTNLELNIMGYEMELINSADELDDVLEPVKPQKPKQATSTSGQDSTGKPDLSELPPEMVVMTFTITGDERDKAIEVLNKIKDENGLKNISESFMELINKY